MKTLLAILFSTILGTTAMATPKVYVTREISPEGIVELYKALGSPAKGHVALKYGLPRQAYFFKKPLERD